MICGNDCRLFFGRFHDLQTSRTRSRDNNNICCALRCHYFVQSAEFVLRQSAVCFWCRPCVWSTFGAAPSLLSFWLHVGGHQIAMSGLEDRHIAVGRYGAPVKLKFTICSITFCFWTAVAVRSKYSEILHNTNPSTRSVGGRVREK